MRHQYPLEWLDSTITVTLNPEKADVSTISLKEVDTIIARIKKENGQLQTLIKNQVFSTTKQNQIKLLIRQYHSSLTLLLDCVLKNEKHNVFKQNRLKALHVELLSCLDELLNFVECRFSDYLSLEERVPAIYFNMIKKELRKKLNKVTLRLMACPNDNGISSMLLKRLSNFTGNHKLHYQVTFRDVLYKKELIRCLEEMTGVQRDLSEYSALEELLIYLNFNSKGFINRFTKKIADKINACESLNERIDQLLLHYKIFNQMHRKPDVILNPKYHSLETVLGNWFKQEITYLEKKMHLSVIPLQIKSEVSKPKNTLQEAKPKVTCVLSTDQAALILRAASDLKVLLAKSMNELFRTLVPHLSTPYRDNLSYDAMRSKAYVAEEKDKEKAIETLEKLIKQIQGY